MKETIIRLFLFALSLFVAYLITKRVSYETAFYAFVATYLLEGFVKSELG